MAPKPRSWLLLILFVCAAMAAPARAAEDKPSQNPALKRLYSELVVIFRKQYPAVTSHLLSNTIHFEHDTRVFIVHDGWITGRWQDPRETRGPEPGGVLCDISLQKGKYQGQADMPLTLDKYYFKILMLTSYSPKLDAHLVVHLSYPRDVKDEFLRRFTQAVNGFENCAD